MRDTRKDYSQHVDHPRYGRSPRHTGLDPDPNAQGVYLHRNTRLVSADVLAHLKRQYGSWPPPWLGADSRVIPGTAIAADVSRQLSRPVQVTHYYDIERVCRDCHRRFIFFAEEQKYWYEELQFPLEADCVRCCDCRRQLRAITDQKRRYEDLCHVVNRTVEQNLEMAECCISLVEQALFHPRQIEHIRQLLNLIPEEIRSGPEYTDLRERTEKIESEFRRS